MTRNAKWFGAAAVAALALAIGGGTVNAAEANISLDVNSAYVWRGMTLNEGMVLQPSIDVGTESGLGLSVWGNVNIDDDDSTYEKNQCSEVDVSVFYEATLGPAVLGVGYVEYLYPYQSEASVVGPASREVYGTASVEPVKGLSVGAEVFYDLDEVNDFYANLGVGYSYEPGYAITLEAKGSVGYAGERMSIGEDDDGGFNEYTLTAGVTYCPGESLTLGANVGYTDSLDEDVLPSDAQDVNLFGGVSASYGF